MRGYGFFVMLGIICSAKLRFKMAKYLVETYYTCTFKVNHYLDDINETELKNLEKRDDGKFEVLDVKLDNRKTKSLDPNTKRVVENKKIEIVSKNASENSISKEKVIQRKESPQNKLVGMELIGKEKANHGDCVHIGRTQVGIVTSACLSPSLGKNIALCRIDIGHSEIGTEVEIGKIDGHQKRIGAKIIAFPFYDPTKSKVRA